jgi:3-deoxy-manno-octulosonate cytidylyltransferase (CMP-KDO synthetase)
MTEAPYLCTPYFDSPKPLQIVKGIDFLSVIRYSFPMRAVAVIPARYDSTRLPGKPLISIKGKPLIQYVYERVCLSSVQQVIVATDDERIVNAVRGFGGEAVLTSPEHRTGTERVAEVAAEIDATIIVNVQGDEPLINPLDIDGAIAPFSLDPMLQVATLITPLAESADLYKPNVVKVVVDREGFALYFSRAPIPYPRYLLEQRAGKLHDHVKGMKRLDESVADLLPTGLEGYWQHIGLYAFRRDFLLTITALSPTLLELQEKLEQLRILEHGYKIKTVVCSSPSIGIDTPDDIERFETLI